MNTHSSLLGGLFVLVLAVSIHTPSCAAIEYKDATSPSGVPDFRQVGGSCWAVAAANCLWYWDHHGYAGLIDHTSGDPGDWRNDGQGAIDRMLDLQAGRVQGVRSLGWVSAICVYIHQRGLYWRPQQQDGLLVRMYSGAAATYSRYHRELVRCQDVIPVFYAVKADGSYLVKDNGDKWCHAVTAAGWDNSDTPAKAVITNGWDGHEQDVVDRNNYEEMDINDPEANGDKLQIVGGVAGMPPPGCDYLEMVSFMTVCPMAMNGSARNTEGESSVEPGEPPRRRYSYTHKNYCDSLVTDEHVTAIGISIEVPFDYEDLDVQSPAGWWAEEWVPEYTPGLSPDSPFHDPGEWDASSPYKPLYRGVVWTTDSSPIAPGDSLSGFSFALPDTFEVHPDASYTAMSSSLDDVSRILVVGRTVGPYYPVTTSVPDRDLFDIQTYPNPFNPSLKISYNLDTSCRMMIEIISTKGERVRNLFNEFAGPGERSIIWDGTDDQGCLMPSGVYFYRARALGMEKVGKMTLVR